MAGSHVIRKFQLQKPLAVSVVSGLQVLGGAYLIPTLKLHAPVRVNGEYDMASIVAHAHANWNLRGPVVLDLSNVSSNGSPHVSPIKASEFRSLVRSLKDANLIPIGITNASEDVKNMAWRTLQVPSVIGSDISDNDGRINFVSNGMPEAEDHFVLEESYTKIDDTTESSSVTSDHSNETIESTRPQISGMKIVESSVRTGQQIYAKGQNLIVLGSVNSGAEVLADGDIHVYGVLKGRALAGIGGNTEAKVFAQKFDAELISIADTFTTCDALEARERGDVVDDRPTVVWLEDGVLQFKSVVPGRP
ncbi:hypothetical protein LEN26_007247 [Aphanomyces euteiches]|nr:hypothetical protein AeMF1_012049 [Aphanomyces euteiches]KAH9132914.1 hypothetical protein LEN26_007247 [Aphanomyces euteiches]KAH9196607.1 hypothetical protein AeNC1_001420 [Aphanomyces euteiches]